MYSSDDVAARLQQRLEASSLAAGDPVLAGIILQLGVRAEVDTTAGDAWAGHWNEQTIAHLQGVDEQSRGLEVAGVARACGLLPGRRTLQYRTEAPTADMVNQEHPLSCVHASCRQLLRDVFNLNLGEVELRQRIPIVEAAGGSSLENAAAALQQIGDERGLGVHFMGGTITRGSGDLVPIQTHAFHINDPI